MALTVVHQVYIVFDKSVSIQKYEKLHTTKRTVITLQYEKIPWLAGGSVETKSKIHKVIITECIATNINKIKLIYVVLSAVYYIYSDYIKSFRKFLEIYKFKYHF